MKYMLLSLFLICFSVKLYAQPNTLYTDLPVGEYDIGFKIVTLTDSSRMMLSL